MPKELQILTEKEWGNNLSTAPGPRTREGDVNNTLTEDVRNKAIDFIKVDPKKSYTPTTLKKALSAQGIVLTPAQNTQLIEQLKVFAWNRCN